MVKKKKVQKITFKSIFRLFFFLLLIFLLINFLDQKNSQKNTLLNIALPIDESFGGKVLGEIYAKLPETSRYQLEHLDQTVAGQFVINSSNYIKDQLNGFPQKQIKQFKKDLIKNVSDELIKGIDNN